MKKILSVFILSISILFACGCDKNTTTSTVDVTTTTNNSNYSVLYDYYNNFDFNKLDSLGGIDLIYYIKSFINVAPGLKNQSYGKLRQTLLNSDKSLNDSSMITLIYSQEDVEAKWDAGKTWNREHVYPKSIGGFNYSNDGTDDPIGWDIHHVRPSYATVNSIRSNSLFGTVTHSSSTQVLSPNGTVSGWTANDVFEPIDEVKGDIARICMYVSIMYYMEYSNVELSKVVSDKTLETILLWNKEDPVSEAEIQRNNYGYALQGNRNIFIDYPEIADLIWG
ncbi:MAG: endonuclease [Gammaproteobacteria bacterium]|nr:endonuclease [Gammaproteobacteria bacterium]